MGIFKFIEKTKIAPAKIIALTFGLTIIAGTILLNLPFATVTNESMGFVNALFTSTSAVCVTGLSVVDAGSYFSTFGQVVLLLLIQVGGLGFMTIASIIVMVLGAKFSLRSRMIMQESLNAYSISGVVRLTKRIVLLTFTIEAIGAFILSFQFMKFLPKHRAIYTAIFHSVSSFCNAGFDIFGTADSLFNFRNNTIISFTTMALIILGGLGFIVIMEILEKRSFKKLSLHSKLVLLTTGFLILLGFVLILVLEWENPNTFAGMSIENKILNALFASVTPRTAGFSTFDYSLARNATILITITLMFIGGSSGSCAGGVKTTAIAVMVLTIVSLTEGKKDVEVFRRRISQEIINKAMAILGVGFTIVLIIMCLLFISEEGSGFVPLVFETFSAYGTVGLSMNLTPSLSVVGKLIITATMFMGRLGGLTVVFAVASSNKNANYNIKYPTDRIMIG